MLSLMDVKLQFHLLIRSKLRQAKISLIAATQIDFTYS